MLYRFPPIQADPNDASFLSGREGIFAKLKIESKASKRTVLMTEHTLLFVIKGVKLLHFAKETLKISADDVFLLKKGIYVMAEYIEEGLAFEALMLFLPARLLKSIEVQSSGSSRPNVRDNQYLIFPATGLIQDFKEQLRKYFGHRLFNYDQLIPLKQKEILLLLMSSGHSERVNDFIHAALRSEPADIESIVNNYLLQPVSISELASLCNRSLASFKREFQRLYHTSPKAWINQRRLDLALLLLQNTDKMVSEIAEECGFESTSYFIRIFKKKHGYTPQSMRAKITIE
jgi:AraC-like DNA-binding protein